ncbi:MAG: MBL fold metallo-hydrolase [Deltaproteobacteria bacterium]|nr:MBL fold metallo-hydrolase [Deltaproteobacteria bacterium]
MKPIQVISGQEVVFSDPLPDVHVASLPIAGCAWIDTADGVVLVDTLISYRAAVQTAERIKGPIKYIIYTHGHLDHVSGSAAFIKDNPVIIANQYLPDRLDNYKMLCRHRSRISAQQFNMPDTPDKMRENLEKIVYPTQTFLGDMTIQLGGKKFELHTARAETDDVCWIWVPEIRSAFIGDLIIGSFPNIGNPWKPTRFALDWAKTLEKVRALNPEYLFCNGAGILYQGRQVQEALDDHIEVIRNLHDQVVDCINRDMHITEMIHTVKIPEHLKNSPYLPSAYSRPEFFVYNVHRWYHGYFDGNPANILPRPEKEMKTALLELIGDTDRVLRKTRDLMQEGKAQLALQVLDILIGAEPENIEGRKLRIELLEILGKEDICLMSRNSWVYFIEQDKTFLRSKGIDV